MLNLFRDQTKSYEKMLSDNEKQRVNVQDELDRLKKELARSQEERAKETEKLKGLFLRIGIYSVSAPQCFFTPPVTNYMLLHSTLLCKK